MPKQKPQNKLSEKEQWERFKKAAKEKGVDPVEAERAFKKMARTQKGACQDDQETLERS